MTRRPETRTSSALFGVAVLSLSIPCAGCPRGPGHGVPQQEKVSRRDINAVLRDHDKELMAIPGVVGVYVGLLENGKTQCLKVMVVRKTPELERAIPRSLEGYSVVVEETGEIRPMPKK